MLHLRWARPLGQKLPTSGRHRNTAPTACQGQDITGGRPDHPHQQQGVVVRLQRPPAVKLPLWGNALGNVPMRPASYGVSIAPGRPAACLEHANARVVVKPGGSAHEGSWSASAGCWGHGGDPKRCDWLGSHCLVDLVVEEDKPSRVLEPTPP